MNEQEITAVVMSTLGVPEYDVSVSPDRITINITDGLTFKKLSQLSEALKTDRIDLAPAEDGHAYSSWTYSAGVPATIIVYRETGT